MGSAPAIPVKKKLDTIDHRARTQPKNPDRTQFLRHHGSESDVVTRLLRETNKSATCMIGTKSRFCAV
jgi:hypothetical protein